jgi:5-methylcytosine-specific restriction endonuclease McrA
MTKDEKIVLLTDNSKTDLELSQILGLSVKYLSVLRKRWGLSKKRGGKEGKIRTSIISSCKVCGTEIKITRSGTRQYCSRKCMSVCVDYRNRLSRADKTYMQSEEYRKTLMKNDTSDYKRYAGRVHRLSQKIYEENKSIINPYNKSRTLCGVDDGYQIDHIIPIRYGFENNIPPEEIARLENLRMLPWKENLIKGKTLIES